MADDDIEDVDATHEALVEVKLANGFYSVADGEELLDYLHRRGKWASAEAAPRPGLILLDLNMPKIDGREALRAIKCDPELRRIPVVVLTTSKAEEDIYRSYDLGVAGYITKPVTFAELLQAMKGLTDYCVEIVRLPDPPA
ncbi:MAG: response regulator [Acidimicrobiia bacterium]